jgi:hypothetical protein
VINPTAKEIARFWSHVDVKTDIGECWEWTGALLKKRGNYGSFRCRPKDHFRAHRFSYLITHGNIPDGLIICHTCHNPPCVNPNHLYAGTHKDNLKDMFDAGRNNPNVNYAVGERGGSSKLKEGEVELILQLASKGVVQPCLRRMFKVSADTIHRILSGKTWRYIKRPTEIIRHGRIGRVNRKGELAINAKLTETDIVTIRKDRTTTSLKTLADKYNTTVQAICNICHYRTWTHVP